MAVRGVQVVLASFLTCLLLEAVTCCSPPLPGAEEPTLVERVYHSTLVFHAKIVDKWRDERLSGAGNDAFIGKAEVYCILKGSQIPHFVNVTHLGVALSRCTRVDVDVGSEYVIFGYPLQRGLVVHNDMRSVPASEENLATVAQACNLRVHYPTGVHQSSAAKSCPRTAGPDDCVPDVHVSGEAHKDHAHDAKDHSHDHDGDGDHDHDDHDHSHGHSDHDHDGDGDHDHDDHHYHEHSDEHDHDGDGDHDHDDHDHSDEHSDHDHDGDGDHDHDDHHYHEHSDEHDHDGDGDHDHDDHDHSHGHSDHDHDGDGDHDHDDHHYHERSHEHGNEHEKKTTRDSKAASSRDGWPEGGAATLAGAASWLMGLLCLAVALMAKP